MSDKIVQFNEEVKMLEQVGVMSEVVYSQQNQYYYDVRMFDLAIIKTLIDTIFSSKFIQRRKVRS